MKRFIRLAAHLYPASWRNRYGVEYDALLDDMEPSWRTLWDTFKGAMEMQFLTWNFRKILAVAGIAGVVMALGLSFAIPKQYASTALIKITIIPDARTAKPSISDYMNSSAKAMLTRSFLTSMIQTFGLYPRERETKPLEDVVASMRESIRIRPVQGQADNELQKAFVIEFVGDDPAVTQQVTASIVLRFMNAPAPFPNVMPMTLELLDAASRPLNPIAPNPWRLATLGLLAGLVLGVFIILFRRLLKHFAHETKPLRHRSN